MTRWRWLAISPEIHLTLTLQRIDQPTAEEVGKPVEGKA